MTMTPLDLLLIGNESLTRECGEIARARGHRIAAVVTRHAGTAAWAREAPPLARPSQVEMYRPGGMAR